MKLGELEREVMEVFWRDDATDLSVREVAEHFPNHAYTTIMTVLTRLSAKGLLHEQKVGRLNTFTPKASREDYITSLILDALADTPDRHAVLAHFATRVSSSDRRFLATLFTRKPKP